MATVQEKMKVFLDKFGPAGRKILEHAEEVEKEAKELGVAFKDLSDTQDELEVEEKARKAKPAKAEPTKAEEETPAEESTETPEVEMSEEEMPMMKKPAKDKVSKKTPKVEIEIEDDTTDEEDVNMENKPEEVELKKSSAKEAETEKVDAKEVATAELSTLELPENSESDTEESDKEAEEDYEFVMGNMTLKEYGDMMAEVFVEALAPMAEELVEIRKLLGRRKEADNLMLESQLEHGQVIEALQKQFDSIETTLKSTRKVLSTMVEEQPKTVVKNFIASQADETVIPEDHRLKQAAPAPDPLGDFTQFVVGKPL